MKLLFGVERIIHSRFEPLDAAHNTREKKCVRPNNFNGGGEEESKNNGEDEEEGTTILTLNGSDQSIC